MNGYAITTSNTQTPLTRAQLITFFSILKRFLAGILLLFFPVCVCWEEEAQLCPQAPRDTQFVWLPNPTSMCSTNPTWYSRTPNLKKIVFKYKHSNGMLERYQHCEAYAQSCLLITYYYAYITIACNSISRFKVRTRTTPE